MKRSEIDETKKELQKLTGVAKDAVLRLLDSDKDNVYTLQEVIEAVMKDFVQQGLEIGFSQEIRRHAIVRATLSLVRENEIVEERIGSEDYYGSN